MSSQPWTVCLTFDFDALSVWLGGFSPVTPAMLSRGEYGTRVGLPRILKLLSAYGISATFFVPGHTADSFPDSVEAILTAGHEVAHHGYSHRDPGTLNADNERHDFELGLKALERLTGHAPIGKVSGRPHRGQCRSSVTVRSYAVQARTELPTGSARRAARDRAI